MVSTGPMPKAMEAEFHISTQAEETRVGRFWPPDAAGPGRAFQPACAQAEYASFQPGGMVTAPSFNGVPCRSPTRLSGAITSPAKRAASSRMARSMSASSSGARPSAISRSSPATWRSMCVMSPTGAE